jgi:hypothetical protein
LGTYTTYVRAGRGATLDGDKNTGARFCFTVYAVRPPMYDPMNKTSDYYKALMLVKNTVDSLTDEQKFIADFWDDNPFKLNVSGHVMYGTKKFSPAGHWMNIVGILAEKKESRFQRNNMCLCKSIHCFV